MAELSIVKFPSGDCHWNSLMTSCHQATSHYLSQCWLISVLPYGVSRPQWVNLSKFPQNPDVKVSLFRICLYVHWMDLWSKIMFTCAVYKLPQTSPWLIQSYFTACIDAGQSFVLSLVSKCFYQIGTLQLVPAFKCMHTFKFNRRY